MTKETGAEVTARAEVDRVVGINDDCGRGEVQFTEDSSSPGGAPWMASARK